MNIAEKVIGEWINVGAIYTKIGAFSEGFYLYYRYEMVLRITS